MEREYEVGLYKHNKVAYENVVKMFETEDKVCVIQATGTGKSFVALQLMYDFLKNNSERHVKFFAPQNGILEQLREHIKTLNVDSSVFNNVEFLTYQSLLNMTRKEIKDMDIDLMVTDEFHRLGAPEWQKRLELIEKTHPNLKVFGMSATPVRARGTINEEDVSETFFEGNVANKYELYQALADGVLPIPDYHVAITVLLDECDDLEERIKNGKASLEEKKEYMEMLSDIRKRISEGESVEDVLKKYVRPDGKYIYFCSKGSDVKELQDKISFIYKDVDFEFYYVHSMEQSSKENNLNSSNFYNNKTMDGASAEGKLRIMFALDMYNEGIHVPDIDGVIMGRGTSSDILFYQQLGRALAVKGDSGKGLHPLVIDLVNNIGAIEELYNRVLQEKENSKEQLTSEEREKEDLDFDKINMAVNFGLSDEIINVLDALNKLNYMSGINGLSFEEKLNEVYEYLQENKCLPMKKEKTIKFSDGVLMGSWLVDNRLKLEEMSQNNEQAQAIVDELKRRKGLSFEEKLLEAYKYLQENKCLPMKSNKTIKFSDGVLMGSWLNNNKLKLEEMSQNNEQAQAIVDELKRRKGLSFEEKLLEAYKYLQENKYLPNQIDKTIKFSDGSFMGLWLYVNKVKLEEMSQNDEQVRVIINELNSQKGLSFEKKLEEVYDYLLEYGELPNLGDKQIKFNDGVLISSWLSNNKLKLEEMSQNDEQARAIINELKRRRGLSFEEKLLEAYKYLQENKCLPNINDKTIKFSDGPFMGVWLYVNKVKLEDMSQNDERARVIINELNSQRSLSFEEKLNEVYGYLQENKCLPNQRDKTIKFSDGSFMGSWLNSNKLKLEEMSQKDEQVQVIINELKNLNGLSFEEKLDEVYGYLQENKCLPSQKDKTIKFSDGKFMGNWLFDNKSKLEGMSQNNEKVRAIINELKRRKGLSFEEKLEETYEYLQKNNNLPNSKNKTIKFSDGSVMSIWINNNKQKIYKLHLDGDELIVKFVNAVLEIRPKYFDSVKKVIEVKKEFEKSKESKKEANNGRGIQ